MERRNGISTREERVLDRFIQRPAVKELRGWGNSAARKLVLKGH